MTTKLSRNAPCPCHSGRKAKGCCAPFLAGEAAPTPEALMRSRYAAYATGATHYLLATTWPDGPHWQADRENWLVELRHYCAQIQFVGLTILSTSGDGDRGVVEFRAGLLHGDRDASFTERSEFIRKDGRWFYV